MSQTDLNVANASGATVRADINAHLDALATQSSGATAPSPTFPNQWWLDTSTNILKQRDNANTAWVNTVQKITTGWIPYRSGTLLGTASERTVGDTTGADIPDNDDITGTARTFAAAQRGSITTLTDQASIATDMAQNNHFIVTLTANRTLANPTNVVAGQSGTIFIVQDAGGTNTLAYGAFFKFPDGVAPVLTVTGSAIDRIDYVVKSATEIHAVFTGDVK